MADCPNCGQSTARTRDWACQWCGYPLVNGSFRQIPKTYQEVIAERLQGMAVIEVVEAEIQDEADIAEASEVTENVVEETVEPEAPETEMVEEVEPEAPEAEVVEEAEQVVEVEPEIRPEPPPEPEPVAEIEAASEDEPVAEDSAEAVETEEPVAEVEAPQPPGIIPVTVEELNEVCKTDSGEVETRFAGSILQITAEVGRIPEVESGENPCIILTSSERPTAMNVLCIFDKQHEAVIKKLSEGQLVTVQGRYDGCVMNILINDCVLID